MDDATVRLAIQKTFAMLADRGVIYDTGLRRRGQIAWSLVPGRKADFLNTMAELQNLSDETITVLATSGKTVR